MELKGVLRDEFWVCWGFLWGAVFGIVLGMYL